MRAKRDKALAQVEERIKALKGARAARSDSTIEEQIAAAEIQRDTLLRRIGNSTGPATSTAPATRQNGKAHDDHRFEDRAREADAHRRNAWVLSTIDADYGR